MGPGVTGHLGGSLEHLEMVLPGLRVGDGNADGQGKEAVAAGAALPVGHLDPTPLGVGRVVEVGSPTGIGVHQPGGEAVKL